MNNIKSNDQVKKIIEAWYANFPEKFDDNRKILKWIKEFPFLKIINFSADKLSLSIKSQVLKELKAEVLQHIKRIKRYEQDLILRQSTLFAKLGLAENEASELIKKLKKLEVKDGKKSKP